VSRVVKGSLGHLLFGAAALAAVTVSVGSWTGSAARRLERALFDPAAAGPAVAVATAADEGYCTPQLKQILRRVLTSCGLARDGQQGRGCQPLEARNVAAMSGADFNALFHPLADRAAIIQFDRGGAELDDPGMQLLERRFTDQRGASYFLVVSRASPEGSVERNRALSQARAAAVLDYLKRRFNDPDLEREVGLLWLGEEFAQLDEEFCRWARSRGDQPCDEKLLNRSAFVAWIDCRL
jgi:outer membrane protein OmpA-like peptidoglycan-associated protein